MIQASVVMYFRNSDIIYNLWVICLHDSEICLLKLRWSSSIKPRYLYEHTLSSIFVFRDKHISNVYFS